MFIDKQFLSILCSLIFLVILWWCCRFFPFGWSEMITIYKIKWFDPSSIDSNFHIPCVFFLQILIKFFNFIPKCMCVCVCIRVFCFLCSLKKGGNFFFDSLFRFPHIYFGVDRGGVILFFHLSLARKYRKSFNRSYILRNKILKPMR